jgi:hypothetical protein
MLRSMVCWSFLLMFFAFAHVALAQEFSADVVNLKDRNVDVTKVYAGKDKVRAELGGRSSPFGPAAVIIDEAQRIPVVLLTERHMYMEAPPVMAAPLITRFWRVSDVNDACPQWKKVAEQANGGSNFGSCTKVGSEDVNGRSTVKYKGVSTRGDTTYVWVDTKLHCVVKTEDSTGGMELRNIQEGTQPASLFEIPAGYTKFDMGSMMRRPQ